jgi:putative membrane protein
MGFMRRDQALLAVSAAFLAAFVYDAVLRPLTVPTIDLPPLPGGISTMTSLLTLFALTHAAYALGWRHAAAFFAVSAAVSWTFEQAGVATGLVYGRYVYTDVLGAKLGHVPVLIPMAWFMVIYPGYVIANLIVTRRVIAAPSTARQLLALSALGAVAVTAWDLVIDPILSGPHYLAWIWFDGGPYYGVPLQNYAGWLLTTFVVFLVFRLAEGRWMPRPSGPVTRSVAALPVVAYVAVLLSDLESGVVPVGAALLASAVMLPLALLAAVRLWRRKRSAPQRATMSGTPAQ